MIDLNAEHLRFIKDILHRRVPGRAVWAFGSRVNGAAGRHSDLDLAIVAEYPMASETIEALKEDFSESDLPFRVDVVEWLNISDEFRRVIEKEYVVVQDTCDS